MALVNVFGEIALDSSVQEVKDSIDSLKTSIETGINVNDSSKQILTDVVGSITYIGKAEAGSLPSSAVWQISKLDESTVNTSLKFADGSSSFNKVWNNRTSYTY